MSTIARSTLFCDAGIATVALLMLVLACGCADAQDVPTVVYKSEFDNSQIDAVESIVDEVAKQWKLRTFRKDREHMKRVTFGQDAFFGALDFENDSVLVITNAGVGTVLTMSTSDYGKLPASDLVGIANDIIDKLRTRLGIELRLDNS